MKKSRFNYFQKRKKLIMSNQLKDESSASIVPTPEPKKKSNKQKPKEEIKVTGTEHKDDVWNCRFYLPKKLHQKVKVLSAYKNVSIQKIMEEALKMYIKSRKNEIDSLLSKDI